MKKALLSILLIVTMLSTMVMPFVSHAGTSVTTNYVMFDLDGGTTSASQTMLTYYFWADDVNNFSVVFSSASGYDSIIEALFATTTKPGYIFKGFKCAYNNKTYTSLDGLEFSGDSFPAAPSSTIHTFTAVWEQADPNAATYSVTLKSGKGGLGNGVTLTKTRGQNLSLLTNRESIRAQYGLYPGGGAEGYGGQRVLIEWNTQYDPTTGKGIGTAYRDIYNVDASVTLYAIWGYNIQYNADGGIFPATGNSIFLKYVCDSDNSNYQNPMTLYGNFDMPVGAYAPTKAGCRRVNMSNGSEFYGLLNADMSFFTTETTAQNLTIPPTGHKMPWSAFHCATTSTGHTAVEFYAIWEPSVTYHPNGGNGNQYSEYLEWDWDPLYYYQSYYVDSCSFSKSGTYFTGWNTKPDGSGISVSPGTNLGGQRSNSDPITLYAQWADGSYGHTHSYTSSVTKAATCTSAGTMTYKCSCGDSYTQAIPALGHNYNNYVSNGNATCTADGTKTSYCANGCGSSNTVTDTGSKLGHTFETYYSNGDATCTNDGTETARCIRCNETDTRTATGSAMGHDFSALVGQYPQDDCTDEIIGVYQCTKCGDYTEQPIPGSAKEHTPSEQRFNEHAPTCTEPGSYESLISCDVCGATISYDYVTVPATGHTPVIVPGVEPTCTNNGKGESSYCSVCSETLSVAIVIPAKGHTEVVDAAVSATCTTSGLTEGKHCSVCGTVTVAQQVVPAKGHTEVVDKAVEATCTASGLTEGKHCSVCGTVTAAQQVVPAKGHTEVVDKAIAPTCTETGLTEGKHCSVCNAVLTVQSTVPALGHKYDAVVSAPTCTEAGYTTYTCSVCGDSYVDDSIDALGHTEVIEEAVEATCTETGLTEGRYCSVCNEVFAVQEVVPALGHKYEAVVTEPTCSEAGYTTYTCSVCGDSYVADETEALGHTIVVEEAKEPTCTQPGLVEGRYCSVCGEIFEAQEVIPALGHKYEAVVTEPTCSEAGYTTYTCSVCGDSYVADETEALGHTIVVEEAVAPTCTETGLTEGRYCSVCNEVFAVQEVVPALGHKYDADVTEPTCSEAGYTVYTCSVCGDSYVADETEALGHTIVVEEAVAPTCTETGLTEGRYCSVCNEVFAVQEVIPALGHSYEATDVVAPTCTVKGYTVYTCSVCGDSYTADPVDAEGHHYEAVVTEPTCTEGGYTTYTCSVCGDTYVADETEALGHTEIVIPAVAPSCTAEGSTEGKYCDVCGEVLAAVEVIPAKGHSFGEWYTTVEPTEEVEGEERRDCANCDAYETKVLPKLEVELPEDAPVLTAKNYNVMLTKADTLTYIRYAKGIYTTGSDIKNAPDCVTLGASKIASFTTDGVCTLTMADGGIYSVWVKTSEGKEYVYQADLSFMEQSVESYGVSITVNNLYGVKDYFICPGDYDSYSDIKANYLVLVTANKINGAHSYTYVVPNPGRYTIYIRYEDSARPATILKTDCVVKEPAFNGNGLQFTVSNLDDVKVIRTAYGEYNTPGDVKRAQGQRSFSGKDRSLKGKTEFTIQYRTNGVVTVAVVYNHGYEVIYHYDVQQKVPSFVQNGNTVTFGQLDGLNLVRYAEGVYETSNQIKNAEGSKAIKASAIVDGFITVTLDPGTYTFCVQYLDESFNYYVVTVEETEVEPEEPEEPSEPYPGYGKQFTITFDPCGGELPEGISPVYGINYGENYLAATGIDIPVPTMEGYKFDGWYWPTYNYWLSNGDWTTGWFAVQMDVVFEAVWVEE